MSDDWALPDDVRAATASRLALNMTALAFSRGATLDEATAAAAAVGAERKAYTTARVEARTTTGVRPGPETAAAYTRKLAELALEVVTAGPATAAGAPSAPSTSDHDLDLHGDREFLVSETAEEHFRDMLAEGAAHRKIRLSTKSFGADAAAIAGRALTNVAPTLTHANLADIIAGRPEDEALAALSTLAAALADAALHDLDLSDNALGEKGVRAFGAALSAQTGLRSLSLLNVGASLHACAAVSQLLTHAGELRCLAFHNNMSGCEGAAHIATLVARAPKLAAFRMGSSRVGPEGGAALAQALMCAGSALEDLDLSDNPLTPACGPPLAALLAVHPGLTRLNLNDTGLEDEGVAALAAALAGGAAPALLHLELAQNEITPAGARALGAALANRPRLIRLNVRDNELESAGAAAIAAGLAAAGAAAGPAWALREVDACTSQIGRKGAVALASAVARAPALTLLALDDNQISEEGVSSVEAVMRGADKAGALGPLDENAADLDEDDEEEEFDEEGEDGISGGGVNGDDGGLADALAATRLE